MTRAVLVLVVAASVLRLAPASAPTPATPRADIATVAWLAGCFEASAAARTIEEQRMAPRAGTMVGMGRTVSSAKGLTDYELTVIAERDGRLLYEAHPRGQPAATFVATSATGDSVVFEAPGHDFPQRVGYRRIGRDSVLAWIDGTVDGKLMRVPFPYRRVACP